MLHNAQRVVGESALDPNRIPGYEMPVEHARVHEVDLATLALKEAWRRADPYLAATAVGAEAQVAGARFSEMMRAEMDPALIDATSTSASAPVSPEVQQHADAQQFQQIANQIDPGFIAVDAAPQDIVAAQSGPVAQAAPVAPQAQFEQPGI